MPPQKQTAEDAAAWAEIDRTIQALSGFTLQESIERYREMATTFPDTFPPLLEESTGWLEVDLALQGAVYQATLYFDEQEGLDRIEVLLRESEYIGESYELLRARTEEYLAYYEALVELHRRTLGPPDFSGDYTTHWDRPEGRFQVEFGQEDRETPVYVRMACCRI